MRKSVILILGLIYVGSIVFIAFFGMEISSYKSTIYVESIECTNPELKISKQGKKYIDVEYYEGAAMFLTWKVFPEDATNRAVEFTYDESDKYDIDQQGLITLYGQCSFIVTIRALDGSNKKEEVTIYSEAVL